MRLYTQPPMQGATFFPVDASIRTLLCQIETGGLSSITPGVHRENGKSHLVPHVSFLLSGDDLLGLLVSS
jgi:hypothetical protein